MKLNKLYTTFDQVKGDGLYMHKLHQICTNLDYKYIRNHIKTNSTNYFGVLQQQKV